MKHILLLIIPLLLTRFAPLGNNESEAKTYLRLYTTVTGTAENRLENWLLANNASRRIIATVEIIAPADDSKEVSEKKEVLVEPKSSQALGLRSANGSVPNTVVVIKAAFTP